jgi:hypothetical protein
MSYDVMTRRFYSSFEDRDEAEGRVRQLVDIEKKDAYMVAIDEDEEE